MEHKIVTSKRGITHYWIYKNTNENAKSIVFTHGLTADHTMFDRQVEYFIKDYTVITWDVPIHGKSRPYKDFSYENTSLELKSILDAENIKSVILVGMSMGGYPSQEFGISNPSMVEGFVALDTTPLGLCYYPKFDRWCLRQFGFISKFYTDKGFRKAIGKGSSITKEGQELIVKMTEPFSKKEIVEQIDTAYARVFDRKESVHFDFPVLILLGEHDKFGKVRDYCKAWSEKEGYPIHTIKDAAHISNVDNYKAVNEEIDRFIKGLK